MSALRRLYERAVAGPDYAPDERDLADVRLLGLAVPRRASVAILATTALIVVDQLRWSIGADLLAARTGLDGVAVQRFLLFLVVPLAIVLLAFRDDPGRYGLRVGDWRAGLPLLIAGLAVMTPIILGLATLPQFQGYYGAGDTMAEPLSRVLANNLAELVPAEFLLRGFLMFTLWRRIGPLALVVQIVPFVLTHLGKPDIELWSTFIGGSIFAWLDWRTGSIVWSALGHVFVLTLMVVAVGGATPS
ncbi:MAG TPA: CPBP family intramembrane glutamic endopeptidase [Candidatus Limnocylindrales bacterium]|nr:CPBP family intramembrane glutamic endopeptidase [Candidatus Limnocylindrales bacterium]